MNTRTSYITQAGVIAAAYAATTFVALSFSGYLAWGPIQFRVSECLMVLALFTPAAVPGLTLGCAVANLFTIAFGGTGVLGLLDVVFGSLATLLGALWMRRFRERPLLALAGPVLFNALIVSAYLPLLMAGLGYYTIPFTSISFEGFWLGMYLFGVVFVGLGEVVVLYCLGYPLYKALDATPVFRRLKTASFPAARCPLRHPAR